MVHFESVKVPRLSLRTDNFGQQVPYNPIQARKYPFDANAQQSMLTPKIGSPAGDYGKPDFAKGRIPGYCGHLPRVIANNPSGKTFGYLTRLDQDEIELGSPVGFATMASPGPWATTYRRHYTEDGPRPEPFSPPMTARDPTMTRNEDNTLKAKFRHRRRDGEREMMEMGLIKSHKPREMRTRPSCMVESGWITSRTHRMSLPQEDVTKRPCSPEGRRPNKQAMNWQVCESYLGSLGLADSLDPSCDKIFSTCDPGRGFSAGELYETPKGWLGFGLQVSEENLRKNIFQHWHTVYYPCPPEYLKTVLARGQCVVPGDILVDGTRTKTCYLTQTDGVEKRDPHTPRKLGSATRVCTTPSIRYAHLKLNSITRNSGYVVHEGKRLTFVVQCKQMGGALVVGGYHKAAEQVGWSESKPKGTRISPYFCNEEIENYAIRKSSIVPYRLLVKVEDALFMPAWTSTGHPIMVPEQSHRDLKWGRNQAPAYASQTLPGLSHPFVEFSDPTVLKTNREGGYECPKPSVPYFTFPENEPTRDRLVDPRLKPSTQPAEPEALVKPSSNWIEGLLPASFKNPKANLGRCVAGVMSEMKAKFSANPSSLINLFKALSKTGDGNMHRSDLAVILVRFNIIQDFTDPIMEELWQTLDADNSGSVSPDEFAGKFGLVGSSEAVMDVLKMKIGARFSKIGKAFRGIDEDKSGTIDKKEFLKLLKDFNLLDGFPAGSDQEIWSLLDRDGSGELTYDEFVEKFAGGDDIQLHYGPASGTRVLVRKHFHKEGTKEHFVAGLCDEGTACYAQQDWDKAESSYRRALALDPNHVVTLCCLSWLLLNHKSDVLGARGLMQRATEIDPHHPYVVWHKAHYM